jgi:hypothetical protein
MANSGVLSTWSCAVRVSVLGSQGDCQAKRTARSSRPSDLAVANQALVGLVLKAVFLDVRPQILRDLANRDRLAADHHGQRRAGRHRLHQRRAGFALELLHGLLGSLLRSCLRGLRHSAIPQHSHETKCPMSQSGNLLARTGARRVVRQTGAATSRGRRTRFTDISMHNVYYVKSQRRRSTSGFR